MEDYPASIARTVFGATVKVLGAPRQDYLRPQVGVAYIEWISITVRMLAKKTIIKISLGGEIKSVNQKRVGRDLWRTSSPSSSAQAGDPVTVQFLSHSSHTIINSSPLGKSGLQRQTIIKKNSVPSGRNIFLWTAVLLFFIWVTVAH